MQLRKSIALSWNTIPAIALLLATITARAGKPGLDSGPRDLLAERPLMYVAQFVKGPTIDGKLDDPAWSNAQSATPFRHFQTGMRSKYDTWAKIGIDAKSLYVAFHCAEAEMGKLTGGTLPPDSMSVYAHDHVELFFMPNAFKPIYYHFSADVAGNRHDERGSDGSWGCAWQAAVDCGTDAWTIEMQIPRKAIGLDVPEISLANFCRTRRIAPGETSAWAKTFGIFHNPARFGRLVYSSRGTPHITALSLCYPHLGENRMDLTVSGATQGMDVVAKGYIFVKNKTSCFGERRLHLGEGTATATAIPLRVKRDTRARLMVTLGRNGRPFTFCDAADVNLMGATAAPVRKVLEPDAAPSMRWIDTERLRGVSYGFGFTGTMRNDGLAKVDTLAIASGDKLHLRGESYFKVLTGKGDDIRFDLAAAAGDSPFTSSIYAVFGPNGKVLGKGIVKAGASSAIRIPTEGPGMHTLLVNSGPASWNPFSVTIRNTHWVLDARGKSTYVGTPVSLHSLADCKLAGFNVGLIAAWQWGIEFKDEPGLRKWSDRLEQLCRASQDAGLRLIPYIGWACAKSEVTAAGDYRKNLSLRKIDGLRPCPLSEKYWERTFLRRALALARLSRKYPSIVGFGLDPESYYFSSWYGKEYKKKGLRPPPWGSTVFFSNDECFCDHCFFGFLKSAGLERPKVAADGKARFGWLESKGLTTKYYGRLESELCALTSRLRKKVHAVNPDLAFAVMLLSAGDNWFCRGLARGLGTSRVPVLDFDEGTYTSGYSTRAVQDKLDLYNRWGAHVVHGGCLWALKHPPGNPHFLSAQMFNFGVYGNGYWFWPGNMSVWRSADNVRHYYSLSGYAEDYWNSIVVANREIGKRLARPGAYRSPLERIEPRRAIPQQPKDRNEWAGKPCYPVHLYPGTRLSFAVPGGRKNVRVLWGFRNSLGDRALLVNMAGKKHRLSATVEAQKANVAELDVPTGGCTGWVEFERPPGAGDECIGIRVQGAKPFFGGAAGMRLR